MPTIKYTREDITKLVNERDQYKQQRDELIKDVEKLREELKHLRIETDEYFEFWQSEKLTSQGLREQCKEYARDASKYINLTEHIRLKALHNPSVSRYKDLMHFIDELEAK